MGAAAPSGRFLKVGSRGGKIEIPPLVVFLFFEAFFSFVNTKEKKAYSPPPGTGGTPAGQPAPQQSGLFHYW